MIDCVYETRPNGSGKVALQLICQLHGVIAILPIKSYGLSAKQVGENYRRLYKLHIEDHEQAGSTLRSRRRAMWTGKARA